MVLDKRWLSCAVASMFAAGAAMPAAMADSSTQNRSNNYRNLAQSAGDRLDVADAAESGDTNQNVTVSGASQIGVSVDGMPVQFTGAQPIEEHGSVLVPLRGVFEALGATVDYNRSTATVIATKGSHEVMVPIGSTIASIDGQEADLSQPARVVNGTALVPLRFVAEALGSYVEWLPDTHMVAIQSETTNVATLPLPGNQPAADVPGSSSAASAVSGVVQRVFSASNPPQIVVRVNGDDRVIALADSATILRGRQNKQAAQVSLSDVQPGDHVLVRQNDDGAAVSVASTYGLIYGTVDSVGTLKNGDKVVVLQDGQTVELAPNARLTRAGDAISPAQLAGGDSVAITTDPTDNMGYHLNVEPPIEAHRR